MVTKKIKHKTADGTVLEADIGAEAKNVSEDAEHMFVTETEKEQLARAGRLIEVTFPASGWSAAVPYSQTVSAAGMTEEDRPIPMFVDDGANEGDSSARQKAYGCISYYDSGNGTVTAVCKYKKPESDCTVALKGV